VAHKHGEAGRSSSRPSEERLVSSLFTGVLEKLCIGIMIPLAALGGATAQMKAFLLDIEKLNGAGKLELYLRLSTHLM
jgi:hypothetical protein